MLNVASVVPAPVEETAAPAASAGFFDWLAGLPFTVRRRCLALMFALLRPWLIDANSEQSVRGFAQILSVSLRESRRLARRRLLHQVIFQVEWLALGRRSRRGLIADVRHVTTDAHDDIAWLAAQSGAIIATLHFGPYALGVAWLLHRYFQGRRVIIIKSDTDDEKEHRAFARLGDLGAEVEFVSPKATGDFHRVAKAVRGGAIAIVLIDLPSTFGRSDPVDFLGRRAFFASGSIDLAGLCTVPLMLFRVRSEVTGDRVELGDMFDVVRHDAAARERAFSRVAAFLTDTVRTYPEQWHMWDRFGEYLVARTETTL